MYTTSNRPEQIANIIEQRKPLAKQIETVENKLIKLNSAIRNLEDHRSQLITGVEDPIIIERLKEINFSKIHLNITTELQSLSKLKARFARQTLNIGVVGRARQGKSRLLQSITGLTAAEIPDGSRQHCTGVKSTICHLPNIQTFGEVEFHSEQSFLNEVINPYYEDLQLGFKPITIEEFANQELPSLPNNILGAELGAKHEHLRRYHTHFNQYSHLLKTTSPRRISQAEIRQYVAQDTSDGQRVFFNYLAVKEVKIYCSFPNSDVGQIALVDMPGLGDTGIGDENRLIKTLGKEVDFILFVRMPKPSGDYWADVDVKLYDTTSASLIELPVKLWSFMILNKTMAGSNNGDNANNCQDLAGTMAEKHINVIRCVTANCADSEEVNSKVLEQALDYLAINIITLDKKYASTCQESLSKLQNQVKVELNKAREALKKSGVSEEEDLFDDLFDDFWKIITNSLQKKVLNHLREKRDAQDSYLREQVNQIFKVCREEQIIPSLEEIQTRSITEGSYQTAYSNYLNEIRTQLSERFLSLDDGLKQSIQDVKSLVAGVLADQGRLQAIANCNDYKIFSVIADKIPMQLSQLKLAFQIVAEFELSYRGLIQHRIRKHLDILTPDLTVQLPQNHSEQDVFDTLDELYPEAVYQCENALKELLSEPSQAAFAMIEEFVDRVRRAKNIEKEWRKFLRLFRADLWPEQFQVLSANRRITEEWLKSLETAVAINQTLSMQMLN